MLQKINKLRRRVNRFSFIPLFQLLRHLGTLSNPSDSGAYRRLFPLPAPTQCPQVSGEGGWPVAKVGTLSFLYASPQRDRVLCGILMDTPYMVIHLRPNRYYFTMKLFSLRSQHVFRSQATF